MWFDAICIFALIALLIIAFATLFVIPVMVENATNSKANDYCILKGYDLGKIQTSAMCMGGRNNFISSAHENPSVSCYNLEEEEIKYTDYEKATNWTVFDKNVMEEDFQTCVSYSQMIRENEART